MKVAKSAARVLASNGVSAQSDFKILANAHSFRILSSGLYSDKISAVLREIGCNAVDSHIAAGCADRPIEIKLPTRLDSDFYIKDFGTGLSHQQILDLYTTYFSSNKGENNEQTGAFGLGSKSPFSYTDSFSVTSAHEGVQRSYSAFIGDTGAPAIALLDERPASKDWSSGLLVSFPVAPKDIVEFHDKAKEVFKWFAVVPVKAGSLQPLCEAPEFALSGSNFGFFLQLDADGNYIPNTWHRESPMVLTGNVCYPLDAERLGSLNAVAQSLLDSGIHLRMPLGSVMPTASREELEYEDRTRGNLRIALANAGQEIAGMIKRLIDAPSANDWQRRVKLSSFIRQLPHEIRQNLEKLIASLRLPKDKHSQVLTLCRESECVIPAWVGDPRFDLDDSGSALVSKVKGRFSVFFIDVRKGKDGDKSVSKRQVICGKVARGPHRDSLTIPYRNEPRVVFANVENAVDRIKAYALKEDAQIFAVCPLDKQWESTAKDYAERVSTALGSIKVVAASSLPRALPKVSLVSKNKANPDLTRKEKQEKLDGSKVPLTLKGDKALPIKTVVLRDIPETSRFYLPKYTRTLPEIYNHRPVCGESSRGACRLYWLMEALDVLAEHGFSVPRITGFVFMDGTSLKRTDLLKRGFRSLPEVVDSAFKDPVVLGKLKKDLSTLPAFDLADSTYFSEEGGLVGSLVGLSYFHPDFKRWLDSALKKLPRTSELFNELWNANVIDSEHRTIDAAIRTIISVFANDFHRRVGLKCVGWLTAYERMLRKKYPRSEFIVGASDFYDLWKKSRKGAFDALRFAFED